MENNQYRVTKAPINSTLTVVQNQEYRWGVVDKDGNIIVPFGKYAWIDGFQNGLAKVIGHDDTTSPGHICTIDLDSGVINTERIAQQGIINESGVEVLPLEFNIWKFYGKDFPTIKYFKGDEEHTVRFETLNPNLIKGKEEYKDSLDRWYASDDYNDSSDYMRDTWDAMTDGMYGDMPDGFDGDFDFMGY